MPSEIMFAQFFLMVLFYSEKIINYESIDKHRFNGAVKYIQDFCMVRPFKIQRIEMVLRNGLYTFI